MLLPFHVLVANLTKGQIFETPSSAHSFLNSFNTSGYSLEYSRMGFYFMVETYKGWFIWPRVSFKGLDK